MQNMPNGSQLNTPQNMQQFAQPAMQAQYQMAGGMPYPPYPQDEEEEKKKKKGFIFWIILAGVAMCLALLLLLWMFLDSTQWKGGGLGQLDNKSIEEIQAELDRIVEEGMMQISIASMVEFADGTSEGELRIENAPSNKYAMQVEITRNDTGEVIYTSDILDPNYHIQFAPLDVDLPAGTYDCIATFHALQQGSHEEAGQAAAKVTIVVNN